jgi:hypothetical protein
MKNQLLVLNTMNVVDGIAGSLVGIFVPIYLLTIGFSLHTIFIYFFFFSLALVPFFILTAKLCQHLGIRKTLLLRVPALFIYLASLFLVKGMPTLVYLIPIFYALEASFYWYPLHIIFTTHAAEGEMGKKVAHFFAWPKAVKLILPLVSAGIAITFGFQTLFIVALIIYAISSIIYLQFTEIKIATSFSLGKVWEFIKKYPRYVAIEVIENWREDLTGVVWPIFVFISISAIGGAVGQKVGILSVGTIGTISAVIALLFNLFAGHLADKHNKKKILNIGFFLVAVVWFMAYKLVPNPLNLYLIVFLFALTDAYIEVPYQSLAYNLAKADKKEEFIVFREGALLVGRGLMYGLAIIFAAKLQLLFLISSAVFLSFLFIKNKPIK